MVLVTLIVSDNHVLQSRARLYTVPMGEKRVLSKRIQFSGVALFYIYKKRVKQFPGFICCNEQLYKNKLK